MQTRVIGERAYDYSHSVGGSYYILALPVSLAFGSEDVVYVLSRQYEMVHDVPWNKTGRYAKVAKLSIGMVPGDEEHLGDLGRYGDEDGQLIWPAGIAVDSDENVYVTDEWLNRISVWDSDGNFLTLWGTAGQGDGEFDRPSGVAIDREDNLYVVDSVSHRIQKLTKDGTFLAKWGSFGGEEGQFNAPWGITVDHEGYVYVADHKNHRAQKFTPEGEFVASFGSFGTGPGELDRPTDVAVDPEGDVYVCDWSNNRVQAYEPGGRFITSFVGDSQQMSKWHRDVAEANADVMKARRRVYTMEPEWRFANPVGVEFDAAKSRLFVAEPPRSRLQIYNKVKDYLEPQFNL